MTHPEELLAGYLDGTLTPKERADADAHLAACELCREEVELAALAAAVLDELTEEPIPVGVTAPVWAELRTRTAPLRAERRWMRLQWAAGLAAAAALVAVVAVGLPRLGGGEASRAGGLATMATAPAPPAGLGAEQAGAPEVALESQPGVDYDAASLTRLAEDTAQQAFQSATGSDTTKSAPTQGSDVALRCLSQGTQGAVTGNDRLVRLIQATYQGTPAYVGVYLESSGAGQAATKAVVWVVAQKGCSVLAYAAKRL